MKGISLSKLESIALEEGRLFQLRRAVLGDDFHYGKIGSVLFVRGWWWSCYDGLDDERLCKTFAQKGPLNCWQHYEAMHSSSVALMPPRTMHRSDAQNFLRITYIKRQNNLLMTKEDFLLEGGRLDGEGRFLGSKHTIKGTSKVFFEPHGAAYSFACDRSPITLKETFPSQDSWLIGVQKEGSFSTIEGQQVG